MSNCYDRMCGAPDCKLCHPEGWVVERKITVKLFCDGTNADDIAEMLEDEIKHVLYMNREDDNDRMLYDYEVTT